MCSLYISQKQAVQHSLRLDVKDVCVLNCSMSWAMSMEEPRRLRRKNSSQRKREYPSKLMGTMPDCEWVAGLLGMSKKLVCLVGWFLIGIWLSTDLASAAMHVPRGCTQNVFLTISGKIGKMTNSARNAYEMSEHEFLELPSSSVTTSTPWTPTSDFVGPLLGKVLSEVEAKGAKLRLIALDNFSVEVDAGYLEKYGTILAASKNNARLTVRDFGPIFVMYPRDSFKKELDTPAAASYLVWQLCGIEVE
jgi:hypothetical protein